MVTKSELRHHKLQALKSLDPQQKQIWDQKLNEEACRLIDQHRPTIVHSYLAMPHEVNLMPSLEYAQQYSVRVAIPKIIARGKMDAVFYEGPEQLNTSKFGTLEPQFGENMTSGPDLIFVPGLAFDKFGGRLGYGGGFYDQFLKRFPQALKVAFTYPILMEAKVPVKSYDIPVDQVITVS